MLAPAAALMNIPTKTVMLFNKTLPLKYLSSRATAASIRMALSHVGA